MPIAWWLSILVLVSAGCGGDVLYGVHALNHPGGVELRQAERRQLPPSPAEVAIHYLRAGGVLFRWQGEAVMTAPFFSNYRLESLLLQRVRPDLEAIALGLADPQLGLDRVRALLVGHSHYDHIGDLVVIARDHVRGAELLVNQSGAHLLAPYRDLTQRARVLERVNDWHWLTPHIRVLPIVSEHAPNARLFGLPIHWASGQVARPWSTPWEQHLLQEQREGTTFAFVIDFLDPADPEHVAFRAHYQDAASRPPRGFLPASHFGPGQDERDVDLAIVCMPGRESLPDAPGRYPTGILRNTRAHHALVIHYEDFFRPVQAQGRWSTVRLLPTLHGSVATEFLSVVFAAIREPRPGPCAHPGEVQGLCSKAYTVPLPGEWLRFPAEPARTRGSATLASRALPRRTSASAQDEREPWPIASRTR